MGDDLPRPERDDPGRGKLDDQRDAIESPQISATTAPSAASSLKSLRSFLLVSRGAQTRALAKRTPS
jgi:hypothetical protein